MSYYGGDRDRGDRDRTDRGSERTGGDRSDRGGGGDRGRPNPCRLYVGKVSRYVREQDLKDLFARYGRIRDLVLRDFYAFIEYDVCICCLNVSCSFISILLFLTCCI
ncbi:uncharacterized protein EV154DRAFT_284322 [Mucor mucedo]|uniref:uncharacterized protein n=1 Tax=Mucor mucedo TaxID=29922 RepID=UPI0022211B6A|nr:uncharacterized protein EV154DRAFT_284322 [Mucor mucedo]KAI7889344.1 hypothetical protein EV154DRAFT_284322 [Mucor mucedo]